MPPTDESDSGFSRKVAERGVVRGLATKDINSVNNDFQDVTSGNRDDVFKLLGRLNNHQKVIGGLDDFVLANIKKEQYNAEVTQVYEYRTSLAETISLLEGKLRALEVSTANNLNQSHASASGDHELRKERIPELELTKFDGNPLNYEEFWDDFSNSVDKRTDMSTITKFKLLKSCLVGNASATCKAYKLTEANYEEVKNVLEERFGDKETAIALHLGALVKLKPASSHAVTELIRVCDECEAHIRALVILGFTEDTFGQLFAPIVLEKLPKFVRLEVRKQKKQSGGAAWTMTKLREILSDEIEVRSTNEQEYFGSGSGSTEDRPPRRDNRDSTSSNRRPTGTASTFFVGGKDGKGKSRSDYKPQCAFCGNEHRAMACDVYKDVASRQSQLVKLNRCFQCLTKGHEQRYCRGVKRKCFYCTKDDHNSSLCLKEFGSSRKEHTSLVNASPLNPEAPVFAPDNVYAVNTVTADGKVRRRRGTAILESALVMVSGTTGSCMARVVFDNGSTKSYMSAKLAHQIGAKRIGYEATAVGRFGESTRQMRQLSTHEFTIVLRDGKTQVVEMNVERHLAPSLTLYPLDLDLVQPFCKTEDLAEIIVESETEVDIDILLGLDYYYSFVREQEFRLSNGLILKDTSLGFVVTGFRSSGNPKAVQDSTQMLVIGDQQRDPFNLEKFWQLEEIGIKDDPNMNDDETALKKFTETVKIVDGRYSVQWPFKSDKPDLPTNYNMAHKRLKTVQRRLMDDVSLLDAYDQIFKTQQELGIIEDAPKEPQGMVHYLCHHAVLKPQSATTKVRLVFDASACSIRHSQSLNDSMYRGPTLMNDLCGMLLRFRLSPVAIVSDVEKAFYQVDLQIHHRDCTRFLWLKDPRQPATPENLVTKRYRRVLFGATASPFLLAATINHHMKRMGGPIADEIVNNTYVDNIISGQPDKKSALLYYKEAKQLFATISMNLREWFSNDQRFIAEIAEPDRGKSTTPSVLGLKWATDRDNLSCSVGNLQTCGLITKRAILKSIASVYDPCGWFGPIVVRGKLILQALWSARTPWDDSVDPATVSLWLELANDLRGAAVHSIPRDIGHGLDDRNASIQLHCFCDTSTKAYGAAVYLRIQVGSEVNCNLMMAKSRVTPLKQKPTIPRLELIAAVIGTTLLDFVSKQLPITVSSKVVWSDSTSVFGWLQSESVLTVFVSNRIKAIKSVPGVRFLYVRSEDNPADIISRGTTLSDLANSSMWWHGPAWLQKDENVWPDQSEWLKKQESETPEQMELETEDCTLMIRFIDVTKGHPLHYTHTFYEMLPMGDVEVTSLWHGYCYLFLQHHGQTDAAEQLLSDPQLMWNPELIFDNVVRTKVPQPNISFLVKSVEVMRAIMLYQLECSRSPFIEALEKVLAAVDDPRDVQFRVYSANNEMIFSSGMQYKHWKEPVRGFDCYATILLELCEHVLNQTSVCNPLFPQITVDFDHFLPATTKSVLVVSDSQGKFFNHITGGHVVAVGGGNFGHMVKVLDPEDNQSEDTDIRSYKWVLVYCGTNCRAKSRYNFTRREFQWQKLRKILVDEAARRGNQSVVFCNSFEHPSVDVSPGLANQVERELHGTGVQCINWNRIGNPFLDPNGMPKVNLFDNFKKRTAYQKNAEIHLNHAGLGILWKTFCEFIPELKFIPMKMSSQPLSIPKYLLDEVQELPPTVEASHGRLQSSLIGINAERDLRRTDKRKSDHPSRRPAKVVTGINARDDLRPSTSGTARRNAVAADEVILHCEGGFKAAKRQRRDKEIEENDLRVTCRRSREMSGCRIYYDNSIDTH